MFAEGNAHTIGGVQIEVQVFELPSHPGEREPETVQQTPISETGTPPDPTSDDHEVGESRSGGCTDEQPSRDEQPSSSNGQANAESQNGADMAPMSVGDWRQSRLITMPEPQVLGQTATTSTTEKQTQDATPSADAPSNEALPLQAVLGAIRSLSRSPGNLDLADEMTQALMVHLSDPASMGQLEGC